ncbi:MAG: periplasmic heavy metal sensor [Opitutaceae bacterium]|nr:periplasmic heavy metal sensor [Opitutaceae bacterium]
MKRLVLFLLLVVAVAAAAYGVTCYFNSRRTEDQWTWLRREFHLSDPQLARIQALHRAYEPVCADHCHRIMAVQTRLAELEQAGTKDSPDYAAALQAWEAVKRECNEATLQHLRKVAAEMDPGQGRRYLALMVPRITHYDHREPRGVR